MADGVAPGLRRTGEGVRTVASDARQVDARAIRSFDGDTGFAQRRFGGLLPQRRSYKPSSEEMEMRQRLASPDRGRHVDSLHGPNATQGNDLDRGARKKQVYRVESTDGRRSVLKPFTGEIRTRRCIPAAPGAQGAREVAAYRLNHMFGWDVVPPAGIAENAAGLGPGVVMKFIESEEGLPMAHYSVADQHRMGVLD